MWEELQGKISPQVLSSPDPSVDSFNGFRSENSVEEWSQLAGGKVNRMLHTV